LAADYGGGRGGDYDYDYDYDQPSQQQQQQQQQQPAGRQSLVKEGHTFEMLPHPNMSRNTVTHPSTNRARRGATWRAAASQHRQVRHVAAAAQPHGHRQPEVMLDVERGYCRDG